MIEAARLLGFAFANADLLFEIDARGTVLFSSGAESDYASEGGLVGHPASLLFAPHETAKLFDLIGKLGSSGRAGPVSIGLAKGGKARLSMCRLPQNGTRISCTLSRDSAQAPAAAEPLPGLQNRESFLAAVARADDADSELALVNVPGLPQLLAKLDDGAAEQLLKRIGTTIKSSGIKTAAHVSPSTFGAVAHALKGSSVLASCIRKALEGKSEQPIEEMIVSLKQSSLSPEQRMLAIRYVVDAFARDGKRIGQAAESLATAFDALVQSTQTRAIALSETMAEGKFTLAYEPIIHLRTGKLSHYEALARFDASESTGEIVSFAEALGIADAFDLAVAIKALTQAENTGHSIAFNVSGHTIDCPPAFGLLAGTLARRRSIASRILVELTETAEITDLARANAGIQALRAMGFKVCIDDFGAGAASFHYLHGLNVDFVKIDGSLVKKLGQSERDDNLLRGIVRLCGELGVKTIAEFIEDETKLVRARDMGFDLGQGHYIGRATDQISLGSAITDHTTRLGKRRGVQESWG
jgi:EAL domain-containing protein (putative c-di-GMP-specific phosphodiesterase class I)